MEETRRKYVTVQDDECRNDLILTMAEKIFVSILSNPHCDGGFDRPSENLSRQAIEIATVFVDVAIDKHIFDVSDLVYVKYKRRSTDPYHAECQKELNLDVNGMRR